MITWLIGENDFELREALHAIEAEFDGRAEKIDGATLTLNELPDLLMGTSLFSTKRLVVISDLSQNSVLWDALPDWTARVSDDIHLVLIDAKPDKRRVSYKALKEAATVHEFTEWSERDYQKAEQWVSTRAKKIGLEVPQTPCRELVQRVGLNQWQLASALETLQLSEEKVTPQLIDSLIPANPAESVFQVFEAALSGKPTSISETLEVLKTQEDPYALFALMSSQALSLAAVTFAEAADAPAKDFGIHPFVASKFSSYARKLGRHRVALIVRLFALTDADMKRSKAEPWLLLERLLLQVSQAVTN